MILLNNVLDKSNVEAEVDSAGRLIFYSAIDFTINSASYNILQVTGLFDMKLPLKSVKNTENNKYEILAKSVGNILSTPILYLLSNIVKSSYRNLNDKMNISRIVLRINNSFSANFPIVVNNADFEIEINTADLSHLELTLVDANLHEIHLLSPIYITISIQPIPDEIIYNDVYIKGFQESEVSENNSLKDNSRE